MNTSEQRSVHYINLNSLDIASSLHLFPQGQKVASSLFIDLEA